MQTSAVVGGERLTLRRAEAAQILALRHAVLRSGLPLEAARFNGDDDEGTRHFGAFPVGDAEAVCCASFMRSTWDGRAAWQLRGMATAPPWRGRGVGRLLLEFAEPALREAWDARLMWCNARLEAVGFYEKQGWSVVSEPFEVPGVGPHRKMVRSMA